MQRYRPRTISMPRLQIPWLSDTVRDMPWTCVSVKEKRPFNNSFSARRRVGSEFYQILRCSRASDKFNGIDWSTATFLLPYPAVSAFYPSQRRTMCPDMDMWGQPRCPCNACVPGACMSEILVEGCVEHVVSFCWACDSASSS